jgi:hypothetical protein
MVPTAPLPHLPRKEARHPFLSQGLAEQPPAWDSGAECIPAVKRDGNMAECGYATGSVGNRGSHSQGGEVNVEIR